MSKQSVDKKIHYTEFFDWMLAIDVDPTKYAITRTAAESIAKVLFS
jgi:hypothetical protein